MIRYALLSITACALLAGCAAQDAHPGGETVPQKAAPSPGRGQPAPDPGQRGGRDKGSGDLDAAVIPPLEATPPPRGQDEEAERFDVSAREVPVRKVLLSLVKDTEYSVVISPGVTGKVTLDLRGVTVKEAMDFLSRSYGYGVERIGRRFLVRPAAMQTRTFRVNYLNVSRKGSSQTQISSGEVTQASTNGNGNGGGSGQRLIGSEVETSSKEDFWAQLEKGLKAILADGSSKKNQLV
ncbi:MAG TPA: secretin N-terminal domain-containing protein, partial [Gammaproteobacteria bacterium]|nr:secretin N-terminal domain-containing protein [Gammaproteobacteria bacterium]